MGEGLLALLLGWFAVVSPVPVTARVDAVVHRDFPVVGRVQYSSSHHDYPATDIFARCGRPVVSPVDGVVLEVGRRDRWDPATNLGRDRGGRFFSVLGADGVRYYGSHLRHVRADVHAGDRVRAGQRLGRVGHSGDARYVGCHLHFGLSPRCRLTGDWWIRRGVVSPYDFLRSWQAGGDRSPRLAVRRWHARHGCPAHPTVDP
ncbi:MAG: M23 family metallopeptidase [Nocardioidaceae bacterium]